MTNLTGILVEIAEAAGEPAAVTFAARVGGTRVYIPKKVGDKHWLVECVGRRAADIICRLCPGYIDVPLGGGGAYPQLRRAIAKRVHELDNSGKSSREITRAVGVTQRTVHRHRAAHRGSKGGKQGSLF